MRIGLRRALYLGVVACLLVGGASATLANTIVVDGMRVVYSKAGMTASFDDTIGALVVDLSAAANGGSLTVQATATAPGVWGDAADVLIVAENTDIISLRLLGRPDLILYVAGEVSSCRYFAMSYGVIGGLLGFDPFFGLGEKVASPPPLSIVIRNGYTLGPLFGVEYQLSPGSLPIVTPDAARLEQRRLLQKKLSASFD